MLILIINFNCKFFNKPNFYLNKLNNNLQLLYLLKGYLYFHGILLIYFFILKYPLAHYKDEFLVYKIVGIFFKLHIGIFSCAYFIISVTNNKLNTTECRVYYEF